VNSLEISEKTSIDAGPAGETRFPVGQTSSDAGLAVKVFLSSLFIQASFNYRGMQNLGFAFSVLPLARALKGNKERVAALLARHLQLFNTHPYLAAPIIGSVVYVEKNTADKAGPLAVNLKSALTCPYAALGDSFFWGSLKPMAAVFSVLLALHDSLLAPLALLLTFNPAHLWIRVMGFVEGYRSGKEGVEFIRRLDLPKLTGQIKWLSLLGLATMGAMVSRSIHIPFPDRPIEFFFMGVYLSLIILCYLGIKRGISQTKMLYLMFIISCGLSF